MSRHTHGIRRILREDLTAAAAKTICAAPVVTGCFIVLLHNRPNAILNNQNGKLTAPRTAPAATPAPLALIGISALGTDILTTAGDVRFRR
jgi:hypothetical protein